MNLTNKVSHNVLLHMGFKKYLFLFPCMFVSLCVCPVPSEVRRGCLTLRAEVTGSFEHHPEVGTGAQTQGFCKVASVLNRGVISPAPRL